MSQAGSGDVEARIARLEEQEQRLTRVLELLAQRAAPTAKTGRDWDAYAAVIASFIGVLALAISGYTAYQQRQQLRAQMWPRLHVAYSTVHATFSVVNQGTGPARIAAMQVAVGGAPVRTWAEVEKAAGFTTGERLVTSWISDAVISPGKEVTFVQPADNAPSRARFTELFPSGQRALTVTVCYCSVLDECWVARLGGPDGDEACPIRDDARFAQ